MLGGFRLPSFTNEAYKRDYGLRRSKRGCSEQKRWQRRVLMREKVVSLCRSSSKDPPPPQHPPLPPPPTSNLPAVLFSARPGSGLAQERATRPRPSTSPSLLLFPPDTLPAPPPLGIGRRRGGADVRETVRRRRAEEESTKWLDGASCSFSGYRVEP